MSTPARVKGDWSNDPAEKGRMTPKETADLINLIIKSQSCWQSTRSTKQTACGERPANSIWPWSGGYRPSMETLMQLSEGQSEVSYRP